MAGSYSVPGRVDLLDKLDRSGSNPVQEKGSITKEKVMKEFWIYAEDMVGAIIGPFSGMDSAREHIKFCEGRGDAACMRVITGEEKDEIDVDEITPEEDRRYNPVSGTDTQDI